MDDQGIKLEHHEEFDKAISTFSFLFNIKVDILSSFLERAKDVGLIEGFYFSNERVDVSHLQFADDTIFFFSDNEIWWDNLLSALDCFCVLSCLKLKMSKCSLIDINMEEDTLAPLAKSWGVQNQYIVIQIFASSFRKISKGCNFLGPNCEKC